MIAPVAFVALSFLDDFGETLGELGFVIRLMSFVYILFWLFATFQDNQVVFGFTSLIAAYFVIFYAPVIVILAAVVLLMINGMFIQQSLMFGIMPALGRNPQTFGAMDYGYEAEQMKAQELHSQLNAGRQISEPDLAFLAQMQQRQEIAQAQIGQAGQSQGSQLSANMSQMQVGMRRMR